MMPSGATTSPVMPVSSATSRTAVCSGVSPASMWPLGRDQSSRPRRSSRPMRAPTGPCRPPRPPPGPRPRSRRPGAAGGRASATGRRHGHAEGSRPAATVPSAVVSADRRTRALRPVTAAAVTSRRPIPVPVPRALRRPAPGAASSAGASRGRARAAPGRRLGARRAAGRAARRRPRLRHRRPPGDRCSSWSRGWAEATWDTGIEFGTIGARGARAAAGDHHVPGRPVRPESAATRR